MCGRVTAVEMIAEGVDGDTTRESVVDYGECQAAASATNPRQPSKAELQVCPIFGENE